MTDYDIRSMVAPLRLVFWGGLIWIVDVTVTSRGFRFDILNDTVAAIMIAVAVARLKSLPVHPRYDGAMQFVMIVAVLSIASTALHHFVFARPPFLAAVLTLFSLCQFAATIVFCIAMRWLCEHLWLDAAARSWQMTTILFLAIYAIPLGLLHVASLAGVSPDLRLGPAALLLLPVFAIPIVHLFISTSRMARAQPAPSSHAFPVEPIVPGRSEDTSPDTRHH